MKKNLHLILFLIVLIVLYFFINMALPYITPANPDSLENSATTTVQTKDSVIQFSTASEGISFQYPSSLVLKENEFGTSRPEASIVLIKSVPEEIDALNGSSTIPREGPPAITIEVYQNPDALNASDFAVKKTNWNLKTSATSTVTIAGNEGVEYSWSGLYEGKSMVITRGTRAYVFSVTWMSTEDQLVKDFDMILATVSFI